MEAMDGDDDGAAGLDHQCTRTSGGHGAEVVSARALHTRATCTQLIQVAAASPVHRTKARWLPLRMRPEIARWAMSPVHMH